MRVELYTTVINEAGSGRTFTVLFEKNSPYVTLAQAVFDRLIPSAKVLLIEVSIVTAETWTGLSAQFLGLLTERKIRQTSLITFGATSTLAQNIYLRNPKFVRSMLFIDGASSPHPTSWERAVNWLENRFPLGLPLRGESRNFDARSHLQRMRCPVMQIVTKRADEFLVQQAQESVASMPTAWLLQLEAEADAQSESLEVAICAEQFQSIPAKCPQN